MLHIIVSASLVEKRTDAVAEIDTPKMSIERSSPVFSLKKNEEGVSFSPVD